MRDGSEKVRRTWLLRSFPWAPRHRSSTCCILILLALARLEPSLVRADGCFVFKWDKRIDINEPTQKAVVVHDGGREDLLLQVKYEGPLEEFGWLIPVPSVPKVEKGSMQPFYELSRLTQMHLGNTRSAARVGVSGGKDGAESVNVIELKTVGAYEVAVLSTRDAGSLSHWLKTHDFSIPEGRTEVIDEYVRQGWYFVAAKIDLKKGVDFQTVSGADPKSSAASNKARKVIQARLASGELHPLLISFDTPKCVFPLKISAVGGKPSEVSLYVLSPQPLLNKFLFYEAIERLHEQWLEWERAREQSRPEREKASEISLQNLRSLQLAVWMSTLAPRGTNVGRFARDWTVEDLLAIGKEGQPPLAQETLYDDSFGSPYPLLQCLPVASEKIPQCAKVIPRLAGRAWYLTKEVRMFQPAEMHDLVFEPAIPVVARVLPRPEGAVAAGLLSRLGAGAVPFLIAASESTNAIERVNASAAMGWPKDARYVEPLLTLLKDELPKVRLNAIQGVGLNWDPRFIEALISLVHDENLEIRIQATQCLCRNDTGDRPRVSLELLKDTDPDVQLCALQVLSRTNGTAIPRAELLRLLSSSRVQTVFLALNLLEGGQGLDWLNSPPIQNPIAKARDGKNGLSSKEAASLTRNPITMARLAGLKILQQNADAEAVELTLPLLTDTNSVVRNRAFRVLRIMSGQEFSEDDPAKWEEWWANNKASFIQRAPGK